MGTVCNYSTYLKYDFNQHITVHHNEERRNVCPICSASYRWANSLLRHMKVKHSQARLKCQLCDFSTFFENDLDDHNKKGHPTSDILCCGTCRFQSKFTLTMELHKIVHNTK